jgi:hypothetical protein
MAVNLGLSPIKIWWKDVTHGSGWNNGVIGSQNPDGNVGGFVATALTGSPYFLYAGLENAINDAWTLNVGATAYAGTPPTNYVNWP